MNEELTKFTNPTMPLSYIPQCTTLEQKCAHFCSRVVHCEIWDKCIVGFVRLIHCELQASCPTSHNGFEINQYWLVFIGVSEIILGMGPANERCRCATSSLTGWAHTQNAHWENSVESCCNLKHEKQWPLQTIMLFLWSEDPPSRTGLWMTYDR